MPKSTIKPGSLHTTEDPNWRDKFLAGDPDRPRKPATGSRRGNVRIPISVPPEVSRLINHAAHTRGISIQGFVRRAVLSFTAQTLGMSLQEVTSKCYRPRGWGQHQAGGRPENMRRPDWGDTFGPWEIVNLRQVEKPDDTDD